MVYIHLREDIIDVDKMYIDVLKLNPIGRLSGPRYAHINDVFELKRPYFNETKFKRGEV